MIGEYLDYNLFFRFFDTFSGTGSESIEPDDPLMNELDRVMEMNNQFFYIMDTILMDMLFVSKGVKKIYGFEPETVSFGTFLTTTHPDDYKRHKSARSAVFSRAHDLYSQKKGSWIISSNLRAKTRSGGYSNLLYQGFIFYSELPYESVFLILVQTDISAFKKIHKGFHFYVGDDRSYFRCPDDELLMSGALFSHTEFKIIELIEEGLSTKEIAQKLFRSSYTINAHRTNIIKKSGKANITEVIRDLKAQGLL